MEIQNAFDALTDLVAEVVSTGLASSIAQHDDALETVRDLRSGAVIQKLLGPQLSKLATLFQGEVERKTVIRYQAYRKHPRMTREPLIDEAEAADVDLNVAVMAAQSPAAGAAPKVAVALAILRVSAVTKAIGAECIYPPHDPAKAGRAGPRQRRREITAADVPDELGEILLRPVGNGEEQAAVVTSLRALERQMVNADGIVTKLIALIDQPDGYVALNTIAGRIRRARHDRGLAPEIKTLIEGDSPQEAAINTFSEAGSIELAVPPREYERTIAPPAPPPPPLVPPEPTTVQLSQAGGLRERFHQLGPKVPSVKDRLAQAHANRKGPR